MALATPITRNLQLQFQIGTNASGQPKIQNRNYTHVDPAALDDDLLAVGQALAGLYADTFVQVARVDQEGLSAAATTTTP